MLQAGTFSIVAHDVTAGAWGAAISSGIPAVGSLCVFAHPDRGVIATQAWVNPLLGVDGLELLETHSGRETLDRLLDQDPEPELRQVAVIDKDGDSAAHTGSRTHPWSGHRIGMQYATAGNILTGEETITAMAAEFETTADAPLQERLLKALEEGQEAGGDERGRQSAALYVIRSEPYPYVDLRVDDHPDPVTELRRIYDTACREFFPFVAALPTRHNPSGKFCTEATPRPRDVLSGDRASRGRD